MTYTIDEAKELYLLSEEKKTLVCAVNFHNRLYTAPAYIHNIIQKDEIGEVTRRCGDERNGDQFNECGVSHERVLLLVCGWS